MTLEIGFAFDTPNDVIAELEEGFAELSLGSYSRQRLPDLAGPNDTLQLIADPQTWVKIGMAAAAAIYGTELVREAAKETWKHRWKIAQAAGSTVNLPIRKIVAALGRMKERSGATATLVVPVAEPGRSPAIDIPTPDPAEIAWRIYVISLHAAAIQEHVEEWSKGGPIEGNPDMRTLQVVPNDDGSVTIYWTVTSKPSQHEGKPLSPVVSEKKSITIK
jgi:hypothetical protein